MMMIELKSKCIRKLILPGAFIFLVSIAASIHSIAAEIFLSPPGLRLIKDPSIVISADFKYANRLILLPAYRNPSGMPAAGWSAKFVETRRFASDRSAWIFFRDSDLLKSVFRRIEGKRDAFRFWPDGTIMIIEIYKGTALQKENEKLIDIAAMSKLEAERTSYLNAFYPVSWTYAKFNSDGINTTTAATVRDCHQCHRIAFHLTGDLIFTRFP
ncbi:MAG: cytochrome P460 family protein [Desulfobacterales bacterium]|jgi:hypothetical protein